MPSTFLYTARGPSTNSGGDKKSPVQLSNQTSVNYSTGNHWLQSEKVLIFTHFKPVLQSNCLITRYNGRSAVFEPHQRPRREKTVDGQWACKGKNLRAAISLRSRATVISIHYTGRIAQVFFSKKSNFFERCTFVVLLRQLLSGAHEARERTRRSWAAAYSSAAVLRCNRVA